MNTFLFCLVAFVVLMLIISNVSQNYLKKLSHHQVFRNKIPIEKGLPTTRSLANYTTIDIETTGFVPDSNHILELAAVRVRNGQIVEKFQSLVNPKISISKEITEINGIDNSMIKDAPSIREVLPKFLEFIGDDVVVAHNSDFDINFISTYKYHANPEKEFFKNNYIDTLKLSRFLYPNELNHKLEDLIKRFKIGEIQEHRALADSIAVYRCYEYMKKVKADLNGEILKVIQLNEEEKLFINTLYEKCKDLDVEFSFGRNSDKSIKIFYNAIQFKHEYSIGTVKLQGTKLWVFGGISNNKQSRLDGVLSDFLPMIDLWVLEIKNTIAESLKPKPRTKRSFKNYDNGDDED